MSAINVIKLERSCDGCTKCCDGWLTGSAYGHEFYPGKKCYWSSKRGCNIYEYRPHEPCVTFKCYWKTNRIVPFEFKPDKIGVILVERYMDGYFYLDVNYGGSNIPIEVIDWLHQMFTEKKILHIRYRKNGKYKLISDDLEFTQMMTNKLGIDSFD